MKLKDILARDLKVWPEGLECLSQLKDTGYIINGKGFNGRVFAALQIADETLVAGAIVTRAEWQAAVDALKVAYGIADAEAGSLASLDAVKNKWEIRRNARTVADLIECGYLVSPSLHLQWAGRAYRFETKPEWSEDGLPNVGTKCVVHRGSYGLHADADKFIGPVVTVTARFKSARGIEMACVDSGDDGGCHVFRADMCFHLPTAEEIAAEERDKVIEDMIGVTSDGITCMERYDAEQLYKAGYRKQVTK